MNRASEATPAGPDTREYRPPYLASLVAGVAVLALYALTLAPTTAFWDTSEYIATAHILGIPHPPGNPLFVVLARAWELLLEPTGLSVAVRINLFSAAMGAAAHAFWFLMVHRILADFSDNRVFRLAGAAAAVALSATAFTVWNHSNVNEKVYTVSLFTIALLSWLAFRWRDRHFTAGENAGAAKVVGPDREEGSDNLLLLMMFILALSVGNHLMAFLAAPALLVFVLLVAPRTLLNWRLYAAGAVVVVIGLSIHLFLPLRASLGPVINEADPSTMEALWASLTRQQYDKPSMLMNPVDPRLPRSASMLAAQLGHYLQYFDWQWARSIAGDSPVFGGMRPVVTLLFTGFGLFGAWRHFKRDRPSFAYVAVLFVTLSIGLVFYLNFRYGYSYPVEGMGGGREFREVRERDYFFIVSFSVWGLWAGIGLAALWQRLASALGDIGSGGLLPRPYALTSPVLALALLPLALNWSYASRADDYAARDWAYNLLMSVEPYSVLFTNGDNDTFPLWYLQEVEGLRRDVTVIVMSYLNTDWYARQLKQLTTPCAEGESWEEDPTRIICQRSYLEELGPEFYAEKMVEGDTTAAPGRRAPTHSILPLPAEQIRQIAHTSPFLTQESLVFRAGRLETTIPPGTVMMPSDMFLTAILNSSLGDRPIYFASTTNAYEELNLGSYLVRQGLAYKLWNGPVPTDSAGIYPVPETPLRMVIGPYIDLPRTDALLWDVFQHRGGIPDEWEHWVDDATQSIPFYYAYAHYGAGMAHGALGEEEEAARHFGRAEAWQGLGSR